MKGTTSEQIGRHIRANSATRNAPSGEQSGRQIRATSATRNAQTVEEIRKKAQVNNTFGVFSLLRNKIKLSITMKMFM